MYLTETTTKKLETFDMCLSRRMLIASCLEGIINTEMLHRMKKRSTSKIAGASPHHEADTIHFGILCKEKSCKDGVQV